MTKKFFTKLETVFKHMERKKKINEYICREKEREREREKEIERKRERERERERVRDKKDLKKKKQNKDNRKNKNIKVKVNAKQATMSFLVEVIRLLVSQSNKKCSVSELFSNFP